MVPPIYFLSESKKKCHIFTSKNIIFSTFRNCFILHEHVFVLTIFPLENVIFIFVKCWILDRGADVMPDYNISSAVRQE